MSDPENFMEQERAEAREARWGTVPAERVHRNPWTGEEQPVPSRAEVERDEKGQPE